MEVYPFLSTSDLNLFEGLYISNLLSQILDFIIIIIIIIYYYYYYHYYFIIIFDSVTVKTSNSRAKY